ncbi:antitermination protein NusB [Oleiagrimonas sp. C23AA]|uniref:antitermination protein NusB n=1 Tax=Oleiagrimonas sp. C23AA TaxID=2719047 RepID=UPI0014246A10|nr:antitermination protein NusB [Oleiagrimonas sp. C23AA]NII10601.1 antitermination protein NusB [Oleiagrimonas sp. C23AA]
MDQVSMFASQGAPFFVGWGTLALVNAGLAQGKNRSGLLWFLLSLLLGPVATLIIVLLSKQRTKLF